MKKNILYLENHTPKSPVVAEVVGQKMTEKGLVTKLKPIHPYTIDDLERFERWAHSPNSL